MLERVFLEFGSCSLVWGPGVQLQSSQNAFFHGLAPVVNYVAYSLFVCLYHWCFGGFVDTRQPC